MLVKLVRRGAGREMANTKFLVIEPEIQPEVVRSGSDRSFGIVFAAAFVLLATWPLLYGRSPRIWFLFVALVFALLGMYAPWVLRPVNVFWTYLGGLLHRVATPIVMGLVFYLVLAPIAFIMRSIGKDPLFLNRDRDSKTYWIERRPIGPDPRTMTRQF